MHPSITALARLQHGVVSRRQLLAAGLDRDMVQSAVRRGQLQRVAHGVYVVPGSPDTPEREMVIAVLRCGPAAVATGERALALVGNREASRTGRFVILTRPERRVRNVPWNRRANPLPGEHRALVSGVPSLRPARLLLEWAVDATPDELERVVDGARWSRRGLREVCALALEHPDHLGARVLRASGLVDIDAGESRRERDLFPLVAHLGAQRQVWLAVGIRVDILLPGPRMVLEYCGRGHAGRDRSESDTARRERLERLGYLVIEVWDEDLADPVGLLARIEAAAATRLARLT